MLCVLLLLVATIGVSGFSHHPGWPESRIGAVARALVNLGPLFQRSYL